MAAPLKVPCVICGEPVPVAPGEKPIHKECQKVEAKQGRPFA